MIIIEKLSLINIKYFKRLYSESKCKCIYNKDFFEIYNTKSFISQYIKRKQVKLFKINNKYIGYLWLEYPLEQIYKILALYIQDEYIDKVKKELSLLLSNKSLVFDSLDNKLTYQIMRKLGFKPVRITLLMKLEASNCKFYQYDIDNFKFFTENEDEKLRCFVQNSVFDENNRIPLVPYDIHLEEDEDYYINDFCVFVMRGYKAIGYGQVIFRQGLYTIVNVGILEGYRGNGYGEKLIRYLVHLCYKKNVKDVHIQVETTNYNALKLYTKVGFKEYGKITTWTK
ncbi:GNAT family N-acetyltransferase [Clostridium uliginosum]|uniref:Ribosomal protein S18 acetylase RimI n=1 Tax=Clostridium uliginosum TaxID=119641 RepID=A0A1I1H056_9CLOT|nr:GNAT family N-acetyltransferase [Clostridium uliginosum]SFC17145.1 Ribosomal protein S18 acetylase RimI [Clostridium uliginosum]